jgi:OFA family oxalate/formate antiporter-like MFS transporter
MYTAKGTASIFVPISSVIMAASGSWESVFFIGCGMNAAAALMAWYILRPMRKTFIESTVATTPATVAEVETDAGLSGAATAARMAR